MRFLATAVMALILALAGLALPGFAAGQEALDPAPMTWRGLQMGPEQMFEGEFDTNFETSVFTAQGAKEPDWVSGWTDRPGDTAETVRRYHVRFVGRRTVEPGRFGRLGAFRNEVLMTRLLEARVLLTR